MKKIILQVCFLFFFLACQTEQVRSTKLFTKYMKTTFQHELKEEAHTYFVINKATCKGCVQRTLIELENLIDIQDTSKYTFVTSLKTIMERNLKTLPPLLEDKTGKLDMINLDIANLTIIKTKNKEIVFQKIITPADLPLSQYLD